MTGVSATAASAFGTSASVVQQACVLQRDALLQHAHLKPLDMLRTRISTAIAGC